MTVQLISRGEWGAVEQDGFYDRPMPFSEFWLHHSATIAPDLVFPWDDDDAAVRLLERIGEQRFGGGISYNQPITPIGRCYVGVSEDRVGAHTKGHNTAGFAFVLVGNYTDRAPTAIQEEIIARRMVELHRAGKATRHTLNGGHRNVFETSCPGDAAYARIPAINRRADELWDLNYPANDIPMEETVTKEIIEQIAQRAAQVTLFVKQINLIGETDAEGNQRTGSLATIVRVLRRDVRDQGVTLAAIEQRQEDMAAALGDAGATLPSKEEYLAVAREVFKAKADTARVEFDDEEAQP